MPIPFAGEQKWAGKLLIPPHPPPTAALIASWRSPRPSHLRRARSLPDRLPDPVRPPHPAATRAAASLAQLPFWKAPSGSSAPLARRGGAAAAAAATRPRPEAAGSEAAPGTTAERGE